MLTTDTPHRQPRSQAISAKSADISATDEELVDLFARLSDRARDKFLAWAIWACDDGRPETDPRKSDPYWDQFTEAKNA